MRRKVANWDFVRRASRCERVFDGEGEPVSFWKGEQFGSWGPSFLRKDFIPEKIGDFSKLSESFRFCWKTRAVRSKVDIRDPFTSILAQWAGCSGGEVYVLEEVHHAKVKGGSVHAEKGRFNFFLMKEVHSC